MSRDTVYYLDPTTSMEINVFSRLSRLLQDGKQNAAKAAQWTGLIRGLTQKGVKQSEIDDVEILSWLAQQDPSRRIDREEVLRVIAQRMPRIKVVDLARPNFRSYVSLDGRYQERLYVLSSESMQIDDAMEDLHYRMQDLGFDPTPLMEDPALVDRLEDELRRLKALRSKSWDFSNHHFSEAVKAHGKNLMAHARFIVRGDLFFIQEIQSDWAQKGRRYDWRGNFPKAPFVTQTELWAGVVVKDLLQTAARMPEVQRVAWLRADMRNGWADQNRDGLDEFYDRIVKKLVDKHLAGCPAKTQRLQVLDKNRVSQEVWGLEVTPQARAHLAKGYALYSRSAISAMDWSEDQALRREVLGELDRMIGGVFTGVHQVRFFSRLYDIAEGREVAGRYWNDGIEISTRAKDPLGVARHEALHFAYEHLLLPYERQVLDMAFAPGGDLHTRVRRVLLDRGMHEAERACRLDAQECAAYAFELWARGDLDLEERPRQVFDAVIKTLIDIGNAIRRWLRPHEGQNAQQIFQALHDGMLRVRAGVQDRLEAQAAAWQDASVAR